MLPLAAISASVATAIIAAFSSLVVAIVSAVLARRNSAALKKLEEGQAETNARIAYNYEARKRLYAVCEPLLFQAVEQAEDARSRICSLAKAARNDKLRPDGTGWLAPPHRYYFKSTVYSLLAPITTFSILQRRLTTIDLSLDADAREKYEVLRLLFFSFSKDWELAECGGNADRLEYDRNKADQGEPERERLLRESPQRYAPQGLYRAMTYVAAEALIAAGEPAEPAGARDRCMTFGEFQLEWERAQVEQASVARRAMGRLSIEPRSASPLAPVVDSFVELFGCFHPKRKPILWRLLVAQYLLYRTLQGEDPSSTPLSSEEVDLFDWRDEGDRDEDFRQPLRVAEEFVGSELASMQERLAR
ncbi:MAG TPA: hypothetical protein VFY04_08025 [Solirubrobacterales bacterium]|nr:hypothetical protein [Solirubrobacterales bacterium]